MPLFIFPTDVRLVADGGTYIANFPGDVEVEIPEYFVTPATVAGGRPVGAQSKEPVVPEVADEVAPAAPEPEAAVDPAMRIASIANVIRAIQDTGDKSKLTAAGKVRTKEIESAVGFDTTLEEREAAEALLEDD